MNLNFNDMRNSRTIKPAKQQEPIRAKKTMNLPRNHCAYVSTFDLLYNSLALKNIGVPYDDCPALINTLRFRPFHNTD